MDKKTKLFKKNVANWLRALMLERGIKPIDLEKRGINKKQLYAVLQMGANAEIDYRISTLVKILGELDILELNI
jgi:hypothetical protein